MSMDWLNLPIVEFAFALGGIIGIVIGFWAGYGVENIVSYHRGYKSARLKNNELRELVRIAVKYCDSGTCDGCPIQGESGSCLYSDMACELGVEVDA